MLNNAALMVRVHSRDSVPMFFLQQSLPGGGQGAGDTHGGFTGTTGREGGPVPQVRAAPERSHYLLPGPWLTGRRHAARLPALPGSGRQKSRGRPERPPGTPRGQRSPSRGPPRRGRSWGEGWGPRPCACPSVLCVPLGTGVRVPGVGVGTLRGPPNGDRRESHLHTSGRRPRSGLWGQLRPGAAVPGDQSRAPPQAAGPRACTWPQWTVSGAARWGRGPGLKGRPRRRPAGTARPAGLHGWTTQWPRADGSDVNTLTPPSARPERPHPGTLQVPGPQGAGQSRPRMPGAESDPGGGPRPAARPGWPPVTTCCLSFLVIPLNCGDFSHGASDRGLAPTPRGSRVSNDTGVGATPSGGWG